MACHLIKEAKGLLWLEVITQDYDMNKHIKGRGGTYFTLSSVSVYIYVFLHAEQEYAIGFSLSLILSLLTTLSPPPLKMRACPRMSAKIIR